MGSSKDIATQAVLACRYEDVVTVPNYIFDRFNAQFSILAPQALFYRPKP